MPTAAKTPKKPAARKVAPKAAPATPVPKLDARPDTLDFRDQMFVPTLIEVPTHIPLADYRRFKVPVLNQGTEGACTGFGLATVANYLLLRRRVLPDPVPVSARMFYEMARRYDEWPGEDYSGSSARGAMKGWHKHGVCADKAWPYQLPPKAPAGLTDARSGDAARRPLGAYFRVNHQDLVAMHSAIAEVGVLYATAMVHEGWSRVGRDGVIAPMDRILGGHAFAIVAYDDEGFWLQNSWGAGWGAGGLGRVSYDDWLAHGTDVWVARLGAPVTLRRAASDASAHAAGAGESVAYAYAELRPHLVSIGADGGLKPGGDYGTSAPELAQIFADDIPRLLGGAKKKRLLLYAHGGLVSERAAVQRVAEYRQALLGAGIYPLAFIWHSDYWTSITSVLQEAIRRRRPEGPLDAAKDFLLNRLDDALEPLARALTGKTVWDEMKRKALAASAPGGGAQQVLARVVDLKKRWPDLEVHLVGHSAGSIFHAPLVQAMVAAGVPVSSCTLWAPACTMALFKEDYLPAIEAGRIERFALFTLADRTEQDDDCARLYNKSLLYLVSAAFEAVSRIPGFRKGVPLLGLERDVRADPVLSALFNGQKADWVLAPNTEPAGSTGASRAQHHGDFDDDECTVKATFARIAGGALPTAGGAVLDFRRSVSSMREQRQHIERRTG